MSDGATLVTVLRVGTMILFIAVFAGIAFWLLQPAGRSAADAQARMVLRDDDTPEARA